MKYVIDADMSKNDCSFCPCFERDGKSGYCRIKAIDDGTGDVAFDMRVEDGWTTYCFDRPDWCPLVPYGEMVVSEWVDSVNSQPFSDEPRETIRVELYKSENEKLGAMSIVNGLSVAQMVARLIDEYKVAKPYINHGNHGPEPRFPGDAWTVWHCCGNCDHPVSIGDAYCKTCGAKLGWSDLTGGVDGRA